MIETFSIPSDLADVAARDIGGLLAAAVEARGRGVLVATGGRSPGPVYDRLRLAPLDWSRIAVTLSDERLVPPASPDSNAQLVRRRFLNGPAAAATFTPLWSPSGSPPAAARGAEPFVRRLLPFDVVMLGMGEDGHIASLIPGSHILPQAMDMASDRLVMGVPAGVGSPPLPRVTLTLPALLQSNAIFLLIAGDAKREVVERALAGADLPVRGVLAQGKVPVRVLWAPSHGD